MTRFALAAFVAAVALAACSGKSEAELMTSGKELLAKDNLPGAIIQFKNAIQKQPKSAQARLLLGIALFESGDPVSAVVEFGKAQELQVPDEQVLPTLARAMLLMGDEKKLLAQFATTRLNDAEAAADLATSIASAHLRRSDKDSARQSIATALQRLPGYLPATIVKARMQASEGDFEGALTLLDESNAPGDARAGVLRGEVLWHGKNDTAAALESFKKALNTNPKAVGAHTSIIAILIEQNKMDESKAQFDRLKKVAPNHPDTLFFEAQYAYASQDHQTTREITNRLLMTMPEHPHVLELAGATDYRQKRYVEAEGHFVRAMKSAPSRLVPRQLLAQTYLRTNQPAKALEVLLPVVEGKSPDGTSLALVGEAWLQAGDIQKSDAAFARAAQVAPNDHRVHTSAAMAQMTQGHSDVAVAQLELIAAEDKGPRADIALISARLQHNDIAGALRAIDGLERKSPELPIAHYLRGRVLLLERDNPGATQAFEAALGKDPNYFPAVASLAAIELSAGKPEHARKRFTALIKAQPKHYQAMLALAELGIRTGAAREEVLTQLRSAIKANAGEPMPHLLLIAQLLTHDPKAALNAAREATAALPYDFEIMEALGRTQLAADDAEQAMSTFGKLAALQPTSPHVQVRLAEALLALKDAAGARRALRRALEIKPDLAAPKRTLVAMALNEKRPQEAMKFVREMQKQHPDDPVVHELEGDVQASLRNWDAATAAYRTAMGTHKTTDGVVRLHATLRASGNKAEAERLAAEWLKEQPKDPDFRYYLGDVALTANEFAAAEAHYRAVLELQPRHALALNNVAWMMVKQGKPGAVAVAEQANEILPGHSPLMDTLAQAYAAENKLSKAIETQRLAIGRTPNDPALKLTLARFLIKSGDKDQARAELRELAKLREKFREQAEVASLLKLF
jgi:putative PEP-CTERM system TPR-repeat lipoprotein